MNSSGIPSRKWGLSLVFLTVLLAGCATSLPKIEPEKLPEPPAAVQGRRTAAGRRRRPPRRSRAESGGKRSTIRSSTSSWSAPTAATPASGSPPRGWRRRAPSCARPTPIARRRSAWARARRAAQGIVGGVAVGQPRNMFTAGVDFSYEVDLFGRLRMPPMPRTLDAQAQEGLLQSAGSWCRRRSRRPTWRCARSTPNGLWSEHGGHVPRDARAHRAALARGRRRRARRGACEHRGLRDRIRCAGARPPRAELEHALAVLVGEKPSRASRCRSREWNSALPVIPAGLPSTLLTRRPDVSAAQTPCSPRRRASAWPRRPGSRAWR